MLEKTIKAVINKKISQWFKTIEDEEVKKVIKNSLVVTGGCFVSLINNESPNDYDCYFRTKEATIKVMEYYVNKWNIQNKEKGVYMAKVTENENGRVKIYIKSEGVTGTKIFNQLNDPEDPAVSILTDFDTIDYKEVEDIKEKYLPVFLSSNAILLSNGIQLIARFYGDPEEIHDTYDFVHTKAYWTFYEDEIVIPRKVYECIINKTLIYTGSKYPVCSVFRLRKFIKRGWTINAGQILKMAMQISELNLLDIQILEDQLIGVDSLYFNNLITQFKEKKEKDPNFNLTQSYVVSIVDKIF